METIRLTERDFQTLEKLRVKRRKDCLAAFSVNEHREIWLYITRGWTKEEKRMLFGSGVLGLLYAGGCGPSCLKARIAPLASISL